MDRAERIGLGVAIAGHAVLFGLLSVGFLATPNPVRLQQQPVEVSLVKDVGLEATAPAAVEPPSQSVAPEQGLPEDAAAPAEPEPASEPAPADPAPQPKPQSRSQPKPEPKPAPSAANPAPAPRPVPRPKSAPAKPAPAAKPAAPAKSATRPPPTTPTRTASTAKSGKPAASAGKGTGSSTTATAHRPRGSRLGNDFLKGLTSDPSPAKASAAAPAARIDARALAGIQDAISRQIQPCADRQVDPGPGANRIVTVLNLRLNQNGTLAATPTTVRQTGVDDENDRYARRVVELGIAAFKGCSPLRLPQEFFSTPNGGWNNINYRWQLR